MAKKFTAVVRLQIPTDGHGAGPAKTRALDRCGVGMTAFSRAFQALKPDDGRAAVPVVVTDYDDRASRWSSRRPRAWRARSRCWWTDLT